MIERTISQSMYDARIKELDEVKESIYKENIDNLTCRMTRKKDNGTWTEADELVYKEADKKCAELIAIEEAKLWNADEKLVVISDEEYAKLIEEEERATEELAEEQAFIDYQKSKEVTNGEQ